MSSETITVAVLCFNSSETILDTLESIRNQTYSNIDLLINDDCSSDDTVAIINDWIDRHRSRFNNVDLLTHESNQGINKSFDLVIRKCRTRWVKPIAGDDILFNDCLQRNVEYVENNGIDSIVYSSLVPFRVVDGQKVLSKKDLFENWYTKRLDSLSPSKQYKKLLKRDINFSPTVFLNVDLYKSLGGIDLGIKNIEDWPLRLMYASSGYKVRFFDKDTVYYRIGDSISRTKNTLYNKRHIDQTHFVKKRIVYPHISKIHIIYYLTELLERFRYFIIISVFRNRVNVVTKTMNAIMQFFEIGKWPERFAKLFMRMCIKEGKNELQDN